MHDDVTQPNTPMSDTEPLDRAWEQGAGFASQSEFTQPSMPVDDDEYTRIAPSAHQEYLNPSRQAQYRAAQSIQVPAPDESYAPPAPVYYHQRTNWAPVIIAVLALTSTIAVGLVAFFGLRFLSLSRAAAADSAGVAPDYEGTMVASAGTPLPTFELATATLTLDIEPWNGTERFTVLLMGLDKRPGESGTAFRTDSMILVSLDPQTKTIGMLSIPRDLYVDIPQNTVVGRAYGLQRINSAYVIGELASPGYGAKLAMQTVQYHLGIRVNDYVVFDFNTVIDGIDMIGGIDVNVEKEINDPKYPNMYYGYEPLYIPVGPMHMNGEMALKFGRSRHGSSDFDRAGRQQQVIMAIREKVLQFNMLPQLAIQAPGFWSAASRNISSGLSLDQIIRLAVYAKDIPRENIKQGVIDYKYVTVTMINGQSVAIPNRGAIASLMVEVFGPDYYR